MLPWKADVDCVAVPYSGAGAGTSLGTTTQRVPPGLIPAAAARAGSAGVSSWAAPGAARAGRKPSARTGVRRDGNRSIGSLLPAHVYETQPRQRADLRAARGISAILAARD